MFSFLQILLSRSDFFNFGILSCFREGLFTVCWYADISAIFRPRFDIGRELVFGISRKQKGPAYTYARHPLHPRNDRE